MDLIHELCPLQLLEVTKKSDILSVLLASIQHLAHMTARARSVARAATAARPPTGDTQLLCLEPAPRLMDLLFAA